MKVSSVNQDPIVNCELTSFFNIKGTSFLVNVLEDIVNMVMHDRCRVEPFFCRGRDEFVVVIKINGTGMEAIEISMWGEFVSSSS